MSKSPTMETYQTEFDSMEYIEDEEDILNCNIDAISEANDDVFSDDQLDWSIKKEVHKSSPDSGIKQSNLQFRDSEPRKFTLAVAAPKRKFSQEVLRDRKNIPARQKLLSLGKKAPSLSDLLVKIETSLSKSQDLLRKFTPVFDKENLFPDKDVFFTPKSHDSDCFISEVNNLPYSDKSEDASFRTVIHVEDGKVKNSKSGLHPDFGFSSLGVAPGLKKSKSVNDLTKLNTAEGLNHYINLISAKPFGTQNCVERVKFEVVDKKESGDNNFTKGT